MREPYDDSTGPTDPWAPIVELRRYVLHPGGCDVLVDLFEREFIETQEAVEMKVIGQFADLDTPDAFVWLRGFDDMETRKDGLASFYDGPVWAAHRAEANATMIDSENVLLLRPARPGAGFQLGAARPPHGAPHSERPIVEVTILGLEGPAEELGVVDHFETAVVPGIARRGRTVLGYFATDPRPNNFPRLPVREGEQVFAWFEGPGDREGLPASGEDVAAGTPGLASGRETLRLAPTPRSLLDGASAPCRASLGLC